MNRRLPIGIQDFASIRKEGFVYVDKTAQIHRLLTGSGKAFFLSRPRRFGKSLLCSTLGAIFEGQRELFGEIAGYPALAIDSLEWDWKTYPVIKLDWSIISHRTADEIEEDTSAVLQGIAAKYGITLERKTAAALLGELIAKLHEKVGSQAIVLVDEYDAPILNSLNKGAEVTEALREFLQDFYRILKGADEHLRFVFITGITKFAKVSVFSAMNNIADITLNKQYATLCGLSQNELEHYFSASIAEMAQDHHVSHEDILLKIKEWYDGFSWDGVTSVYNLFSILLLLNEQAFKNYWFETATPDFIIKIIKERNDVSLLLEETELHDSEYNSFDYRTLATKLLLFQSGYLTIKSIQKQPFGNPSVYILGIPNEEVKLSMLECLVSSYAEYPVANMGTMRNSMEKDLFEGNAERFESKVKELFANIPHQLHIPQEAYYHSLLLVWLKMLGFDVQGEYSTSIGRIDAVLTLENQIIVAEVKYAKSGSTEALLKKAFKQIYDNKYADSFIASGKAISLLAIGFAGRKIACRFANFETPIISPP